MLTDLIIILDEKGEFLNSKMEFRNIHLSLMDCVGRNILGEYKIAELVKTFISRSTVKS